MGWMRRTPNRRRTSKRKGRAKRAGLEPCSDGRGHLPVSCDQADGPIRRLLLVTGQVSQVEPLTWRAS